MAHTTNAEASGTFAIGGDLKVNRLGYGAMRITGEGIWGEPRDAELAKKVLERAVELGVNFIDTSDAYGPAVSERLIGEALAPYEGGVVIATKGGLTRQGPNKWLPVGRPEYLRQEVEMSLRYLKLERIDLWQLHRIDPKVPVEESLGEMAKMQKEGKIRHIGLSEVKPHEIDQARKVVDIVSIQNKYNLSDREHEDVVDYCTKHNLGFIPWFPIAAGRQARCGCEEAQGNGEPIIVGLAAAPLSGDSPDPRNVFAGASGREYCSIGCKVDRCRMDGDRSRRKIILLLLLQKGRARCAALLSQSVLHRYLPSDTQ